MFLHERQAEILRLPQFMGQELGQQGTHLPIGRLSAPQDHRRVHERRGIYNEEAYIIRYKLPNRLQT